MAITIVAKESGREDVKEDESRTDVLPMEEKKVIPLSLQQARENVVSRVREAAGEIANGLINEAKSGELAPAKYLFEVTGLYPAIKEAGAAGNSLAEMLLKRLGIPTEQSGGGADKKPSALASDGESNRRASAGGVES